MLDWVLIVAFTHHSLDGWHVVFTFIYRAICETRWKIYDRKEFCILREICIMLKSKNMHKNVLNIRVCAVFDSVK